MRAWLQRIGDKRVGPFGFLGGLAVFVTAIALLAAACGSSKVVGPGAGGTSNVSVGTVTTDRGTFDCAESSNGGLSCDWANPIGANK